MAIIFEVRENRIVPSAGVVSPSDGAQKPVKESRAAHPPGYEKIFQYLDATGKPYIVVEDSDTVKGISAGVCTEYQDHLPRGADGRVLESTQLASGGMKGPIHVVKAVKYVMENQVRWAKYCNLHDKMYDDVIWDDASLYLRAMHFEDDGKGIFNPHREVALGCPNDCGLCDIHISHTGLANMVVTNECDLNCWYCFFYAEKAGYIYAPDHEQFRFMASQVKGERPIGGTAFQITGGEPTLREDLDDIIRTVKQEGIGHIQLNTDSINMSKDPELAGRLREAGTNTLYMSFDGTTARTNPKNHWEIPRAMKNYRKAGLGAVLVPTVIKGVNDDDVGSILRFAEVNSDIVRGVNYQPVSLVGRMDAKDRMKYRITSSDVVKNLEDQTNGELGREDWFPVPCLLPMSHFIETFSGRAKYELSNHFSCGVATYIFKDEERHRWTPITKFFDVMGFLEDLRLGVEYIKDYNGGKSAEFLRKAKVGVKVLASVLLNKYIDKERVPTGMNLRKTLTDIMVKHDYSALGDFHKNSLYVGMMHFQDESNWEIERIKRCDIHYIVPDPNTPVMPFCTFNVYPEVYRDKSQKGFSIDFGEYQKITGIRPQDKYYKRNVASLMAEDGYAQTYAGFVQRPKATYWYQNKTATEKLETPDSLKCGVPGKAHGETTKHPTGLSQLQLEAANMPD